MFSDDITWSNYDPFLWRIYVWLCLGVQTEFTDIIRIFFYTLSFFQY